MSINLGECDTGTQQYKETKKKSGLKTFQNTVFHIDTLTAEVLENLTDVTLRTLLLSNISHLGK